MKNFLEKYKDFMVLFFYVLCVGALFQLVILPLNEKIKEKKKISEEMIIDYEISVKKIKEIPLLKEKIDSVSYLEPKLNVFVEVDKALSLIENIEKIAFETGSEIDIIVLNDGSKEEDVKKLTKSKEEGIELDLPSNEYILLKITILGDFNSIVKFISKIENFKYFSDIISINISKEKKENEAVSTIYNKTSIFSQSSGDKTENGANAQLDINKIENPIKGVIEVAFYIKK